MSKREVFVELFDAHWVGVLGFVRRRVADREEAEEIAADVFRIAWEKLDPFSPFERSWLIGTAMNRIRTYYRGRQRKAAAEEALARLLEEAPAHADLSEIITLRQAIAGLSGRERDVLLLTYWEGLSAEEVATALGCTAGAVWTALSRSRAKLRLTVGAPMREVMQR